MLLELLEVQLGSRAEKRSWNVNETLQKKSDTVHDHEKVVEPTNNASVERMWSAEQMTKVFAGNRQYSNNN